MHEFPGMAYRIRLHVQREAERLARCRVISSPKLKSTVKSLNPRGLSTMLRCTTFTPVPKAIRLPGTPAFGERIDQSMRHALSVP